MIKRILLPGILLLSGIAGLQAGNPDRQGEAGAYELLMNPWARSAGLHTISTSHVRGVEALQINVAGLSRINKTEVSASHSIYLQGTDITMNAFGLAQRLGKNGVLGFSLTSLDFGDLEVTTTNQPEGTGATFSPQFFNLGIGYSHMFENKVSVGITFRGISESIADVSAFGLAIDAGIQYVTGERDNFRFGISLRNVGSRMQFGGEGLAQQRPTPGNGSYQLTYEQRAAGFELPSMLNIGMGYDFYPADKQRLSVMANFTSNSFSQDQVGAGAEYSLNDLFMVRGAYQYEFGSSTNPETAPLYTGPSAGATLALPTKKGEEGSRLSIDYAYRVTKVWNGTHNIGVRLSL